MGLVVDPLALVLVAVDVPEGSLAVCLVEAPFSFVASAVLPDLHSPPMTILALPLTDVLCTVLEYKLGSILDAMSVVASVRVQTNVCGPWKAVSVLPLELLRSHYRGRACQTWHVSAHAGSSCPRLQSHNNVDARLQTCL